MLREIRSAVNPDKPFENPLFLKISVPIAQGPRTFVSIHTATRQYGLAANLALCPANGLLFLYAEGSSRKPAGDLLRDLKELIAAAGGYLVPLLAHRSLLASWGARVEPALHQLALRPIKDRLDPAGVFPAIV